MSEFRLTGWGYCSEWNGDDANTGQDQNLPKKTIASFPSNGANILIVGTGVYNGGWTGTRRLVGDGYVIIDGDNQSANNFSSIQGLYIKNFSLFGNSSNLWSATDCVFENILDWRPWSNSNNLIRCIFLPRSDFINTGGSVFSRFLNSIVLENYRVNVQAISFSYLAKGKKILYSGTSANFTDSLINGVIEIAGVDYELKQLFDGSPRPDADPLIADLSTASGFSNVYTNRNFAGDPKFLDVLNKIVEPDSDFLKRSNANGFIGGVKAGRYIPVNTSNPDVVITTSQINTSDPSNWVIANGFDEGFIDIKFKVSEQIVQASKINVDALLAFDGSVAGGTAGNNNVPDATPEFYSPLSQPNLKPNRKVYLFRSSKAVSLPTTDAGWDNDRDTIGTPVVAGEFYPMEWSSVPSIRINDEVAYGNADFTAPGGVSNIPDVRWINIKVRLTNLRSYA